VVGTRRGISADEEEDNGLILLFKFLKNQCEKNLWQKMKRKVDRANSSSSVDGEVSKKVRSTLRTDVALPEVVPHSPEGQARPPVILPPPAVGGAASPAAEFGAEAVQLALEDRKKPTPLLDRIRAISAIEAELALEASDAHMALVFPQGQKVDRKPFVDSVKATIERYLLKTLVNPSVHEPEKKEMRGRCVVCHSRNKWWCSQCKIPVCSKMRDESGEICWLTVHSEPKGFIDSYNLNARCIPSKVAKRVVTE